MLSDLHPTPEPYLTTRVCPEGVTRALQKWHKSGTRVLQECYKSITSMLQECYKSVTRVLQECYKSVTDPVLPARTIPLRVSPVSRL
jgi:hypothetical protein